MSSYVHMLSSTLGIIVYTPSYRHPNPKFRPQFGQIAKVLTTNGNYLLGWSEEDKQTAGKDALKLGAPLECGHKLFINLQQTYKSKVS